jgi:virginiamycin B lyase
MKLPTKLRLNNPERAMLAEIGKRLGRTAKVFECAHMHPSPNAPVAIISGPDGALWFTNTGPNIGRITTTGAITFYPLPNPGASPGNIVVGPDGALGFPEKDVHDCSFSRPCYESPPYHELL